MEAKFELHIEARDDAAEGYVRIIESKTGKTIRVECRPVDRKMILGRETALAFMFREVAISLFRRCFPEYPPDSHGEMPPPEQVKGRVYFPGEPGHSTNPI